MSTAYVPEHIERPGISRLYLGMLMFLVSEAFLFGNLFFTYYYLRAKTPVWPPQGVELELPLIVVNTAILLTSSVIMQLAIIQAKRGNVRGVLQALPFTMLLGAVFLSIKGWEWLHGGFAPWDHAYGSIFFTMTGFHGLHVLAGIILLGALTIRTLRRQQINPLHVETGGLYWHFVDLVWIFVFTSIYIIR